jgi:hypothetical protein
MPRSWPAFVLLAVFSANPASAQEYFVLMFGSQRSAVSPNDTHSFATFVKMIRCGPQPSDGAILEAHTISWLPANLKIRVGALLPEPGHNYDLPATLAFAQSTKQRVSMWGPYPIHPDLFRRALKRKWELESGRIRYKAVDAMYGDDDAVNCIHAIGGMLDLPRLRVASVGFGDSASRYLLKDMEPWIFSKAPVTWISSGMDLDRHPIVYRDFVPPGGKLRTTYGPPVR